MKKSVLFVLVVAVTSICSGQWLERQLVLGDTFGGIGYPGKLVVNPISANVYIEAYPNDQVFNPATVEKMRGPGVSGSVVFCPPSGKGYVIRETLLTIDAAADTVIGKTVLPFGPDRYAYSRTSNRLYLGSVGDPDLLVFDPDGDSILETVAVGFGVWSLQWDTVWNRVYIGGATDTAELRALDCARDTLSPGIHTGLMDVSYFTLSTVSHKLYCAGLDSNDFGRIVVVSTDSLRIVNTRLELPASSATVYSAATDRLYVISGGDEFYVVDCRTDTIRTQRTLDEDISAVAVSSLTGTVYLGSDDSAQVMVMDTTDSVVGIVRLPGGATIGEDAMAFSPDRNQLYGATGWDGIAFAVDASADTLAGWVSYQRRVPSPMVYNPAGNKLYLLFPGQGDILVFDSTFGTPKRIPCSMHSPQAMLNQTLNRLYVATGARLRVIDCNSDSLIASKVLYGISHPIAVMVPYLNKVYVFSADGQDSAYAYDCLRDEVSSIFYLPDIVTGAVYDPRSNRVFFSCGPQPTVRALDPVTDSVVNTFDLVNTPYHGRMAVNVDLGRLYYTDQLPTRLFTIDVLADSVVGSDSLPWGVEALFMDRRLGKLFMCGSDPAKVLVYDCNQRAIVDTIDAGFTGAGLMDDRNDKLYLSYGAVVDCRYDSVVTRLDSFSPSSMAWDAIDNRVFQATTSRLYVYRDDPYGIAEQKVENLKPMLTVLGNPVRNAVKLRLQFPPGQTATLTLHDVAGRLVRWLSVDRTSSLELDLKSVPAGVYFIRLRSPTVNDEHKIIVTR